MRVLMSSGGGDAGGRDSHTGTITHSGGDAVPCRLLSFGSLLIMLPSVLLHSGLMGSHRPRYQSVV